jgi:acetyltransferase-like isoleucine patch superfamily enzyme
VEDQTGWRMWWHKRRWYERNQRPLRRFLLDREMARRGAYVRHPIEGEVLDNLRAGKLNVGQGTHFEPGCWITMSAEAKVTIGDGCYLNRETMIAAEREVTIGDHVMFANGCFIGDAAHRFDDPDLPITWQGFTTKGPVRIGSNCWFGVHCVVTGGVTIGDRCVIGANSVVTSDLPDGVIAAGIPARVIREIEFRPSAAQDGAPAQDSGSQSQE